MIIQGKTRFISAPFSYEQELETVVQSNAELIFGPDSIYLLDTSPGSDESAPGYKYYDINITDLMESGLLSPGQSLFMSYKPRGG